jgi:hypothetical protein
MTTKTKRTTVTTSPDIGLIVGLSVLAVLIVAIAIG